MFFDPFCAEIEVKKYIPYAKSRFLFACVTHTKHLIRAQCTAAKAHTTRKNFPPFPSEVKRRKNAKKSDAIVVDIFDILRLFFNYSFFL